MTRNSNTKKLSATDSGWKTGVFISISLAALIITVGKLVLVSVQTANRPRTAYTLPELMPWNSIGGCGAGGSGGGGAAVRWIGEGASGGLIRAQLLASRSLGQNFSHTIIMPRISVKPKWNYEIGVTVPVVAKSGEVQASTLFEPKNYSTGGLGDITFDVNRTMGSHGQFSLGLGVTVPTGQYDIKRGSDAVKEFLPLSLQKGAGVYNASLLFNYTRDVNKGLWMAEIAYNHPFNLRLFTKQNAFLDTYYKDYAVFKSDARFYYRAKPYGENDLGGYVPPGCNACVYYAYRGQPKFVHSFGLTFYAPFAVAWVHEEQFVGENAKYDPRPDPDHKAWNASLSYGVEISRDQFPLFFAVSLPIHDKKPEPAGPIASYSAWDAPDWNDFLQQWTFTAGVKAAMF